MSLIGATLLLGINIDASNVPLAGAEVARSLPVVSPPPGSHYDVFKEVGRQMRDRMHRWVSQYDPLETVLRPYARSHEGAEVVAAYAATNAAAFPNTWKELQGLADGSGLDFETVFLMELRVELLRLARASLVVPNVNLAAAASWEASQECSDIKVKGPGRHGWHVHNEDASPALQDSAYIVNATFIDAAGEISSGYLGFHYPLTTIGHSMGFNIHGIEVTENSVTPVELPRPGDISAFFLNRHVMDATDFADAVARASLNDVNGHYSSGASLNIGSLHEGILGNVELSPGHDGEKVHVDVRYSQRGIPQFHFNMYLHTAGLEQVPQTSSIHRLARAKQLETDFRANGALEGQAFVSAVVSDHDDVAFPVYRTNAKVETAASALFDLGLGTMAVWFTRPIMTSIHGNGTAPDFVFDMRSRTLLTVQNPFFVQRQQMVLYF